MTTALAVAAVVILANVTIGLLLWRFQERIVFQPPHTVDHQPPQGATALAFVARDGVELLAHVVGTQATGRPAVLAFHGNAVIARALVPWAREVSRRFGVCVVLPEYRGYDGLNATPTYPGVALDAAAAADAAALHCGIERSRFVIFGHSLGSAVATELAAKTGALSLVLQSPFTSARDMVARWPVVGVRLGWSLVSRVHYDTVAIVSRLDIRVFVAHGERDAVVPPRMGRQIFAAARRPGELLMVPEAGHNDVAEVGGEEYWAWFGRAIGDTLSS